MDEAPYALCVINFATLCRTHTHTHTKAWRLCLGVEISSSDICLFLSFCRLACQPKGKQFYLKHKHSSHRLGWALSLEWGLIFGVSLSVPPWSIRTLEPVKMWRDERHKAKRRHESIFGNDNICPTRIMFRSAAYGTVPGRCRWCWW